MASSVKRTSVASTDVGLTVFGLFIPFLQEELGVVFH